MSHTLEIFTSSIIVVGQLNPAIITPDWLERNGLIGAGDAETARDTDSGGLLISNQVSNFETKWFSIQVLEKRFTLTSKDALNPAFKDLAAGIFQILSHTPVTAVGINFMAHYRLTNTNDYHKVGDKLAPKDTWDSLFDDYTSGLANLQIQLKKCPRDEFDKTKDQITMTVQPSTKVKNAVFLAYNNHINFESSKDFTRPAEKLAEVIDEKWDQSWNEAETAFNKILTNTLSN